MSDDLINDFWGIIIQCKKSNWVIRRDVYREGYLCDGATQAKAGRSNTVYLKILN